MEERQAVVTRVPLPLLLQRCCRRRCCRVASVGAPRRSGEKQFQQQKILWAEVQKETGRWKSRWKIRDQLADRRCGRAVLDFLSSTDVGRIVPLVEESDAGSEVSEGELRERRIGKRSGGRRSGAPRMRWPPGRNSRCSFPPPRSWHWRARIRGRGALFLCSFLCGFPSKFPWGACIPSWDRPGRRQMGSLQRAATARTADRKPGKMYAAMIYIGCM